MATVILVKKGNSFIELPVGNDEYRFVEGTEGNAVVNSKGEILKRYCKSRTTGERKDYYEYVHPTINRSGYLQVSVPERKDLKLVHRIVAETFLSNPQGYTEIDHINRDKSDNRACNLRWCTHSENMRNSTMQKVRSSWKNIVAEDLTTGEIYEFSRSRDIIPFSLQHHWGRGWSTAIHRKLESGGGVAYQFYWTAKTKETLNIR